MFAKIFTQIFDSSIAADPFIRHFFMDMLILADRNGVVDMTPKAISGKTRIPLSRVNHGIKALESPDPESRTPDYDGRRIVRLDEHRTWGWFIPNFTHYHQIASDEQRRAKTLDRVKRFRAKMAASKTSCNAPVTPVNACNATQTETKTYTKTDTQETKRPSLDEVKLYCAKAGISEIDAAWFFFKCEGNGWTNGGKPIKRWGATLISWKTAGYLPSQKSAATPSKPVDRFRI